MKLSKHHIGLTIDKQSFQDAGDGLVSFPGGQVISDGSKQRNGTQYDIPSMDLSEYKHQLTADHVDMLQCVIGKVLGVAKTDNAVTISGIKFAVKENPLAQYAYDMFVGGYLTDFSIETYGPWPDESDETYYNAKLIGLSMVVVGNNRSATTEKARELVLNSIQQAETNGLDTTDLQKIANELEEPEAVEPEVVPEPPEPTPEPKVETPAEPESPKVEKPADDPVEPEDKPEVKEEVKTPVVETQEPEPKVEVTPPAEPVVGAPEPEPQLTQELNNQEPQDMKFVTIKNGRDFATPISYKNAAGETVEVELAPGASVDVSEDQKEAVEGLIASAEAPKPDLTEAINAAVAAVTSPLLDEMKAMRQEAFDARAKEPAFVKDENGGKGPNVILNKLDNMPKEERMKLHLEALASAVTGNSILAMQKNEEFNQYNLDKLKEAGKVDNAMTLAPLGNFVLGPEFLPGVTYNFSNFGQILDTFKFEETLDLNTAWLTQNGELTMTDTNMTDAGDNTNLKPISEYSTTTHQAQLSEFAAVTAVDASAVRFAATDIVGNLNKNYNNAYAKALATSVVGQIVKTLQSNGQFVAFDYSAGSSNALLAVTNAYAQVAEFNPNGVILLTEASRLQLLNFMIKAGPNGPFANLFGTDINGQPTFLDRKYVIVPSQLQPLLNSAQTKSLVFEGNTVSNNFGLLIADPTEFMGRVSGGLSYNVSSEAAYEVGGVVKSSFQRDQLVFRGYGYRKSAILNATSVAGISAPGIS